MSSIEHPKPGDPAAIDWSPVVPSGNPYAYFQAFCDTCNYIGTLVATHSEALAAVRRHQATNRHRTMTAAERQTARVSSRKEHTHAAANAPRQAHDRAHGYV